MRSLFIFDCDGTLCDSLDASIEVLNGLADRYHFRKVNSKNLGMLKKMSSREVLSYLGISYAKLPFVLRSGRQEIHARATDLRSFPRIPAVLKALRKQGARIGVLSSNSEKMVSAFLRREKIEVDFLTGGSSIFGKARLLGQVLRKQKFDPEVDQIFYVGDETRDLEAAKAVGIQCVAVGWGYNTLARLRQEKPDFVARDPRDLLKIAKGA